MFRNLFLLMTLGLVGCYSTYAIKPDADTATLTLKVHTSDGSMEIFAYEEDCKTIRTDSEPLRLGGVGLLNQETSFTIEANRSWLIGLSLAGCTVGYEVSFDADVLYELAPDHDTPRSARGECALTFEPQPAMLRELEATTGVMPRPICQR